MGQARRGQGQQAVDGDLKRVQAAQPGAGLERGPGGHAADPQHHGQCGDQIGVTPARHGGRRGGQGGRGRKGQIIERGRRLGRFITHLGADVGHGRGDGGLLGLARHTLFFILGFARLAFLFGQAAALTLGHGAFGRSRLRRDVDRLGRTSAWASVLVDSRLRFVMDRSPVVRRAHHGQV